MISAREQLIAEIEAFCRLHEMPVSTFGRLAFNNTALVHRMRKGRNVGIDTAEAIRLFMKAYRPPLRRRVRAGNDRAAA